MDFVKMITEVNSAINSFVWGPIMLALLVGTGIYFTIRTGFFQFVHFGHVWKNTFGKIFEKQDKAKAKAEGGLTPFQAVATAMAGTIGTGNIVGVTTAIVAGGPGAVFWMWVSAAFGMITKFSEVTLAVKFREKNVKGEWSGGPMYYITNGLGKKWKWLAVLFALLAVFASFGIGNLTQINSIATSASGVYSAFAGSSPTIELFGGQVDMIQLIVGVVVAAVTALVIIGGVTRIGQVTGKLVPLMSVIYISGALIALIINFKHIPDAFIKIFEGAFSFQAVGGGVAGYVIMQAIRFGFARGVFSNEAGLGSAPIAHAAANTDSPVKQGMFGIFEVFIDTLVVCTVTALVVISSGLVGTGPSGAALASAAYGVSFGQKFGSIFLSVCILFFAFSTIIGWSYYGEKCLEYIVGVKYTIYYKIAFVLVVVIGAITELTLVWDISDTLNGLMAVPNLIALLMLSGVVVNLVNEYKKTELDRNRGK